jgi:hypothetical protein
MKKSIYAFLAVLTVFAMVMMGCDDGDSGSTEGTDNIKVEGETLVQTAPKFDSAGGRWGGTPGVANDDGSYTFNGTEGQYNGDGGQYNFPAPKAGDKWKLSDYDLFEIHFKTISGSVQAIVKKGSENVDCPQYPSGSQYITFDAAANDGVLIYKTVISEAVSGLGFQRNQGGPATVRIDKVVYSKGTKHTITFSGGAYTAMPAIPPLVVLEGRPLSSNSIPRPTWAGHTFIGWKNTTDNVDFDLTAPITKNISLEAQWKDGEAEETDMRLDLNPANWGDLPPCPPLGGAFTPPEYYAESVYEGGKLILTFAGLNRQRAIIPLSDAQIEEILWTTESGVTFRFDATIKDENGVENPEWAGFRCHLANPTVTSNWNGTTTGGENPLSDRLVEFVTFANTGDGWRDRLSVFSIQAMFRDEEGQAGTIGSGFPKLIITINSIAIEIGDTTNN